MILQIRNPFFVQRFKFNDLCHKMYVIYGVIKEKKK